MRCYGPWSLWTLSTKLVECRMPKCGIVGTPQRERTQRMLPPVHDLYISFMLTVNLTPNDGFMHIAHSKHALFGADIVQVQLIAGTHLYIFRAASSCRIACRGEPSINNMFNAT